MKHSFFLSEMNLKFKKGITAAQIEHLVLYTKEDPEIIKFTSDPVRFKNIQSAKKWISNVTTYTLVDNNDNLMGITWFHQKPLPQKHFTTTVDPHDFPITFAIRLYGEARGKGLALDFMKNSFETFFYKKSVWIETSSDNIPTIKTSQKFGFVQVSDPDERGKIIMVFRNQP